MIDRGKMLKKVLSMFRPSSDRFLSFDSADVVRGPNDRALVGFETHFPKRWLIEDFGFTREEADWFVAEVRRLATCQERRG